MYNLKDIRNDFDTFVKTLKKRNIDIDLIGNLFKKRKIQKKKKNLYQKLKMKNYLKNPKKFPTSQN